MRSYDFIVVGAGAAGCIVASRLSEDPGASVLVLEAGRERRSPILAIPAAETVLMGNPKYDWCFQTDSDPTLDGRRLDIPRGRLLGGSNAINGMLFVRGQRQDYDDWSALGNPGWSWEEVLPYFKQLESAPQFDPAVRGQTGPVAVGLPRQTDRLCDAFLHAAHNRGFASNPDYNSGCQDGFGYYQVNHLGGTRSSALGSYLKPARLRPNLDVVTEATVTGVQLDGTRCTGVAYQRAGQVHRVASRSSVILCAGAIQSPQILELSGIGQETVLRRAGIPVRHMLPGVGESFRDHFAVRMRWRVRAPITFNDRARGLALAREGARYLARREGLLSLPIALAYGFVSSTGGGRPDLQYHFAPASYSDGSSRRLDRRPGMTLGVYPLRPEATGSVHIRSADPTGKPAISSRFLESEGDRRQLIAGVRLGRSIINDPALADLRGEETAPGPACQSDAELVAHAVARGGTSYHTVGTCRMGPDPLAVVDHRLRVHGIDGLRVIDASIMPTMVSGNTNAASLMIGERGAALVKEDCRVGAVPVG